MSLYSRISFLLCFVFSVSLAHAMGEKPSANTDPHNTNKSLESEFEALSQDKKNKIFLAAINELTTRYNQLATYIEEDGVPQGSEQDRLKKMLANEKVTRELARLRQQVNDLHEDEIARMKNESRLSRIKEELKRNEDNRKNLPRFEDFIGKKPTELLMLLHLLKNPDKYGPQEAIFGFVFHGPPGTGKTMLPEVTANEAGIPYMSISATALKDKYYGGSAKEIDSRFDLLIDLIVASGCGWGIFFIDEADAIMGKRGDSGMVSEGNTETVNALLTQLNGAKAKEKGVHLIVIASTNMGPADLDPAITRSKRLEKWIEFKLPDKDTRALFFAKKTTNIPLTIKDISIDDAKRAECIEEWARASDELSFADLDSIIKNLDNKRRYENRSTLEPSEILDAIHEKIRQERDARLTKRSKQILKQSGLE